MWTDWRPTIDHDDAGEEKNLELATGEDITSISGYNYDNDGYTYSLQAETSSSGRQWGPFGQHFGNSNISLRSSPPTSSGLRLHHLSGDQSYAIMILRWRQL